MSEREDRRHVCNRIIGVERRGAPIQTLEGHPLPDPTRLLDEDFEEASNAEEAGDSEESKHPKAS